METDISKFEKYMRAANYLTAAQIFLKDNFLLERELTFEDIKPRLLGHWGSGPGISLSYSHLSHLAKKHEQDMMFVLGPGHGFPALQAGLFLEGTLARVHPQAQQSYDGIGFICRNFSWPYGFPSHSNPGTPGVILEGGELGYALATSYGAVLDNPSLIVACLVGDGEAETGPAAGAWHLNKLVNPAKNGAVLPILHLNGYKISAPTVYGRMSDQELMALFSGYGYRPYIVSGENLHQQMEETLEHAYATIQDVKSHPEIVAPRMPMIIMRTLKGWTGPKELNGNKIEGNCLAHQVVLTEAKTDVNQLRMLEQWLKSYNFGELFKKEQGFVDPFLNEIFPEPSKCMGASKYAHGGDAVYKPLQLPDASQFAEDATKPGTIGSSSMRRSGLYLAEVFKLNEEAKNFRFMSPDETYSNKLDEIFKQTKRAWVWPHQPWDKDMSHDGRAMEMLSEHNLQGLAQGYVLTGRHAVFASYEAFLQIIGSMVDQYAKFLIQSKDVPWRGIIPSINYILTSSGWRQDHNGFSHQNPGFIDDILQRQSDFVDVYFPPDGNSTLAVLEHCLATTRQLNVIVAGKTLEPRWLTIEAARQQLSKGIATWDFASNPGPDIVLAGVGDYPTKEVLAAIDILESERPDIRLRCVNIMSLTSNGIGQGGTPISTEEFNQHFTADKPVVCNFHGYPQTLTAILFDYPGSQGRFSVRGYIEHGSTTTPFDMHVRNKTSRYHLVIEALNMLTARRRLPSEEAKVLMNKYQKKIDDNTAYIKTHGVDMPEIDTWRWNH